MNDSGGKWRRRMHRKANNPIAPKWERESASKFLGQIKKARVRELLGETEAVTQLCNKDGSYRDMPRFEREIEVSVVRGCVPVEQATRASFARLPYAHDTVRYLSVGTLVEHTYVAVDTAHPGNAAHASIFAPLHLSEDEMITWWRRPDRVTLEKIAAKYDETEGGGDEATA